MEIATVIPAYNEAETIEAVVSQTLSYVENVIVIDDGSQDGTAQKLHGMPVTVLRNEENSGKAASLLHGFKYAASLGAQLIITLDADGQHFPEDIPRLLDAAKAHKDRIIIGARVRNWQSAPLARKTANAVADFWISWAAGHSILDTQSGFRCYPANVLQQVSPQLRLQPGFVFESEILIEASNQGFLITAVPVNTVYRKMGRASYYRPWHDTFAIILMVASKLLARGLYPKGLVRSLDLHRINPRAKHVRRAPFGVRH